MALFCVNGRCKEQPLRSETAYASVPKEALDADHAATSASLELRDDSGVVISRFELPGAVTATRWTPNGEACSPVCWRLNFSVVDGRLARST